MHVPSFVVHPSWCECMTVQGPTLRPTVCETVQLASWLMPALSLLVRGGRTVLQSRYNNNTVPRNQSKTAGIRKSRRVVALCACRLLSRAVVPCRQTVLQPAHLNHPLPLLWAWNRCVTATTAFPCILVEVQWGTVNELCLGMFSVS